MFRKTINISLILIGGLLLLMSFAPHISDILKLTVEPNHSTIQFSIPISGGITKVTGKFTDYAIDINLIDNDLTKSNISAIIKAASINTGISGRDDHLRTKDFFEVETYPEITFVSDSIVKNNNSFIAHGMFSMHGISKNIELPLAPTGQDGKHTFGFATHLSINRMDYGVGKDFKHTAIENFLGNNIDVEIYFWTKKKKVKKPAKD